MNRSAASLAARLVAASVTAPTLSDAVQAEMVPALQITKPSPPKH